MYVQRSYKKFVVCGTCAYVLEDRFTLTSIGRHTTLSFLTVQVEQLLGCVCVCLSMCLDNDF